MKPKPIASINLDTLLFKNEKGWAAWLGKNYDRSPGVWLKIAKKESKLHTVSYAEALQEALSYGWIDGQKKGYDDSVWLQRFTRRGARSIWSKINRGKAEELIERGKMKPAGLAAVVSARADGRWDAAYASQRGASVPADLQQALDQNLRAQQFFATLDSINRYAILHRIETAIKPETRVKRIDKFIRMLEKKEKIYP
jgi:uncharacterized protein YdeI (YjbR/CyaY-like superfamily)